MIGTTYPDRDFAAARAQAVMLGVALYRQEDEHGYQYFIATRGHQTEVFDTLPGFLEWLDKLERRHGTR